MPVENKRLTIEIERIMRMINREAINPIVPELSISDIKPIMEMVAHARAAYLKELCDLTKQVGDGNPLPKDVKKLRLHREVYEELVAAHKALDVAIERGYLDVKLSNE